MKIRCIVLLFVLCTTSLFCMNMGDVNSDGSTNILDSQMIARYYVGMDVQPFNKDVADVDCSGRIDITDALFVSRYYVRLIVSFPCAPLPVIETHVMKYFLHPDLAGGVSQADLEARLAQYTDEINGFYSRQTGRRFSFDPATGIIITADEPYSGNPGTLPLTGYEIWVHAVLTANPDIGSRGGGWKHDVSGAGVVTGMEWDAIHDPSTLQESSPELEQYWRQITTIAHEMGHIFGAALGEYYSIKNIDDNTGIDPVTNVNTPYDVNDPYWSTHTDYFTDPMTLNIYNNRLAGSPTTFAELRKTIRFTQLTANIVNMGIRDLYIPLERTLPDLSTVTIRVKDAITGEPVSDAIVYAWNISTIPPHTPEPFAVDRDTLPGIHLTSWPPYPHVSVFGNDVNMKLFKVHAPGYESAARWVSVYDCSEQKVIYGIDHMVIDIALTPVVY